MSEVEELIMRTEERQRGAKKASADAFSRDLDEILAGRTMSSAGLKWAKSRCRRKGDNRAALAQTVELWFRRNPPMTG